MENTQPYGFVYTITNQVNGKVYVGQTVDTKKRWWEHRGRSSRKGKTHLHRAMRKYGKDRFTFRTIGTAACKESLDVGERFFVWLYQSTNPLCGYNMTSGGGASGRPTDEVREKMRASALGRVMSEEAKEKLRAARSGSKASEDTKAKMSAVRKGKHLSESHRAAISRGLKGNSNCKGRVLTELELEKRRKPRTPAVRAKLAEILKKARLVQVRNDKGRFVKVKE